MKWQKTWRNPVRYMPVARGQKPQEPGRELWSEHTDQVRKLRDKLRG